jgi:outer membrane protein
MYKRLATLTIVSFFALCSFAYGEFKLAYIDVQKALNVCDAGKAAAVELNKEMEAAQQKWGKQGEELKREKETLEKQASLLDEEVLSEKMRTFRSKYRDWERLGKDAQNDIRARHNEMVEKITSELIEIADTIGQERGYTLILERSLVPYIDPKLDITDQVVKRHNEQHKKKNQ